MDILASPKRIIFSFPSLQAFTTNFFPPEVCRRGLLQAIFFLSILDTTKSSHGTVAASHHRSSTASHWTSHWTSTASHWTSHWSGTSGTASHSHSSWCVWVFFSSYVGHFIFSLLILLCGAYLLVAPNSSFVKFVNAFGF